jgi:hypothetical protein
LRAQGGRRAAEQRAQDAEELVAQLRRALAQLRARDLASAAGAPEQDAAAAVLVQRCKRELQELQVGPPGCSHAVRRRRFSRCKRGPARTAAAHLL